jgi:hypothetical protein
LGGCHGTKTHIDRVAVIAATGELNIPSRSAGAWWMDGIQSLADPNPWIDYRLMDQGQLEWNSLIRSVDTGVPLMIRIRMSTSGGNQSTGLDRTHDPTTRQTPGPVHLTTTSRRNSLNAPVASIVAPYYGGNERAHGDQLVQELSREPSVRCALRRPQVWRCPVSRFCRPYYMD